MEFSFPILLSGREVTDFEHLDKISFQTWKMNMVLDLHHAHIQTFYPLQPGKSEVTAKTNDAIILKYYWLRVGCAGAAGVEYSVN